MRNIITILFLIIITSANLFGQRSVTLGTAQDFTTGTSFDVNVKAIDATHFFVIWKTEDVTNADIFGAIAEVDSAAKTVTYGTTATLVTDPARYHELLILSPTTAIIAYESDQPVDAGLSRVITFNTTSDEITNVGASNTFHTGNILSAIFGGITMEAIDADDFLISYSDADNSNAGLIKTCNATGTTITFGATTTFDSTSSQFHSIEMLDANKFALTWEDDGSTFDPGKACIGTITGTDITMGSHFVYNSSLTVNAVKESAIQRLDATRFVLAFTDNSDQDRIKALVATVSGSDLTFGAKQDLDNSQLSRDITIDFLQNIDGEEFVVGYNGGSGGDTKVAVGSVSGNTLTFDLTEALAAEGDNSQIAALNASTIVLGYVNESDTTDIGQVRVGTLDNSTLPVELNSFTLNTTANSVNLFWQTATEKNNYGFEIERTDSRNGNWNLLGFINGKGNSNNISDYSFTDNSPLSGKSFYRLKQIDLDGEISYSNIIETSVNVSVDEYKLNQNYPNPFNPTTIISFNIPSENDFTNASLIIYDAIGNQVKTLISGKVKSGYSEVEFNASNMTSGIYFYSLRTDKFHQTKKMLLLK